MRFFKSILSISLLLLGTSIFAATVNKNEVNSKDVLLVLSYQATHRWTNDIVNAIQEESQYSPYIMRFNVVEMDSMRIADAALQEKEFRDALNDIESGNYDVIMAIDEEALDLVLKYYDRIPKSTNIIFAGIETYSPELRVKYPNITGVTQHYDIAETVANALKLYPDTNRLVILFDSTKDSGKLFEYIAKSTIKVPQNVIVEYLDYKQYHSKALLKKLDDMPDTTLVLFSPRCDISANDYQSLSAFAVDLAYSLKRPFLVSTDSLMGVGALGGNLNVAKIHGQKAAKILKEVLNGKNAYVIPVIDDEVIPVFDYSVMQKYNLDSSVLPSNTIFLNRMESFFVRNFVWLVVISSALLAIILFLSVLILNQRRQRKFSRKIHEPLSGRTGICNRAEKIFYFNVGNEVIKNKKIHFLKDIEGIDYPKISAAMQEVFRTHKKKVMDYSFEDTRRAITIAPLDKSVYGEECVVWYSQDNSELQELRRKTEEAAEWFKLTLNSIGDGVITTDMHGNIVLINPVGERMLGCKLKDVKGLPHEKVFHIVSYIDDKPMPSPLTRALRTGNVVELANHTDLISKNGYRYHISDSAAPIKSNDEIIGAILVFRDVTEEYTSRDKLRAALMSLEAGSEMMNSAAFSYNLECGSLTGSKNIAKLWPIKDGNAVSYKEWIYEKDREMFRGNIEMLLSGKIDNIKVSYRAVLEDKIHYYRMFASIDKTDAKTKNVVGMVQNITDITEDASKLKDSQELWDLVVNAIPVVITIKDAERDFRYVQVNKLFANLVGIAPAEIIDKNDREVFKNIGDAVLVRKSDMAAIESRDEVEVFEQMVDAENITHHFRKTKIPFCSADKRKLLLTVGEDITELNRLIEGERIVNNTLKHVLQTASFNDNLEYAVEQFRAMFDCDRIMLAVCNEENLLRLNWEWHSDKVKSIKPEFDSIHYKLWDANIDYARQNKILVIKDLRNYPMTDDVLGNISDYVMRSLLGVPIFIDNKLWGLIIVTFANQNWEFTEKEDKFLRSMASIIALAQINERQKNALEDASREKQIIIDNISIPIWLYNGEGNLLRVNNAVAEAAKMPIEELTAAKNHEIFCRRLAAGELTPALETAKTGLRAKREVNFMGHDYIVTADPVYNKNKLVYIVKSAVDVSELNLLLRNQKLLKLCVEILLKESDLKKALSMVLQSLVEYFGSTRSYVMKFDSENLTQSIFVECCANGSKEIFDKSVNVPFTKNDPWIKAFEKGEYFYVQNMNASENIGKYPHWDDFIRANNLRDMVTVPISFKDKLWGDLGILFENTATRTLNDDDINILKSVSKFVELILGRQAIHDQLIEAMNKAQAADRAKSFFIASVSHEIRTPLNAVIGFSELLKAGGLDEHIQQEYIDSISFSGNALLQLINDVLDLSKLEANQMMIEPEPTVISEIGEEIIKVFEYKSKEQNNRLIADFENIPPLYVDKLRLRQILFNLMGNAIKFTKNGAITLEMKFEKGVGKTGELSVAIIDTGMGISKEDITKLMQPFVQLSKIRGANSRNNGTGLGLSITKRLVERMNGEMKVESEVGKGSKFSIVLKNVEIVDASPESAIKTAKAQAPEMLDKNIDDNMAVLIVDDVDMNLSVMRALCKKAGWKRIDSAQSGIEALELLKMNTYHLILTDMWMPNMSGSELARRIRLEKRTANIPIIAVTADIEAKENFSMEAFSGVLLKPVTLEKIETISREQLK